ncbi:MAG: glycosyltransferase family A protein [Flavobacteriaceae bacterium]|jgi:glycosyltransferase involved in cell wall biosynthesis|nr:glycosyltransferase family A protein [Flavobacteriaceae bacterium]
MKTITIFTPTYNRAYCLDQLYQSLVRQTNQDFEWLVIDDGSFDNTEELVQKWIAENKIAIRYIYKENGGMHTGHNVAYRLIETELNVCVDSDDYMPDDAVEIILDFWKKNKDERCAGILGLDIYRDGRIVSNRMFPENIKSGKYYQLKGKYGISGDIKFVYRTSIINKYPEYPVFKNESFTPLGYKYLLVDQDYDMLFLNKPLCIVEYLPDGSTKNIIKQYFKNPNGFIHERKIRMLYSYTFKERFKNAMHYVFSCMIIREKQIIKKSTNKALTILAYPFGILLYKYLKGKYDREK